MSYNSPKKEILRCNSLFNKEKIRHENSIESQHSKIKEKRKHKERDKEKEKEKENEINKLIKNILSINLAELKEAIHKEYLQFQHRINESIQNYSQTLKNISACEKRLIEQFADIKMKVEKVETTSDKLNNVDDRVTTYEIRLTNLLRDFQSACTKYDSLFIDNMTVPGKIGNFCKYRNIREFLSFAFNKFNEFDLKKESDNAKMKNNQEKIDKFTKKIKMEMDILREESIQISNKKVGFVEKKLTEEIDVINNKISSIPNNILFCDIEKRMNDCFNNIKNMKDEINNKLKDIEIEIENLKEMNKSSKTLIFSPKKEIKTTFTSLTGSKFHRFKKTDSTEHHKNIKKAETPSSKNIHKSISLHGHKSHFYKEKNNVNNSIEADQNANLDNINEEYNESNDNSPTNNMRIKSKKYLSHKFKLSEKSLGKRENKKIRSSKILTTNNIKDLESNSETSNEESEENNIEIIEENKSEENIEKLNIKNFVNKQKLKERSNSFSEHIDLFMSNSREMIKSISNVMSNRTHKGKRKTKNSFSFPSENRKNNGFRNEKHNNSLKMNNINKMENQIPKHNNKNRYSAKEISKNKEDETTPIKTKENSLSHKKDLIVAKNSMNHNINHKINHNINHNINNNINRNIISEISHNINPNNNIYKNNNINNENHINNNNNISDNNINNININNKNHNKINNITINSFNNNKDDNNDKNINTNIINNNYNNMNNNKIQISENNININDINNNNNLNKTQKVLNIQNIELPNSNNNNKTMIHNFSQKIVAKNKSYEIPKINNNYSTSVSVGSITDNSFLANIRFSNKEINNKKEIPIKQAYFNLFKLECLKKEELLKNGPSLFVPKEIPIITNSLVQSKSQLQSNSKSNSNPKKPKNEKTVVFSKNKISLNLKNQEKDRNIKLKIVPTNFKESKKIQINN